MPHKDRKVGDTIYGFTKDKYISVLCTKNENKAVILMSILYHQKYTDPETGKPEIIW